MFKIQIVWGKKSSLRIGFMAVSTGISVLPGRKHGLSETPNDNDTNLGEGTVHH